MLVQDNTPKIRVVIRKRPVNKKELNKGDQDIIEIKDQQTVTVSETKVKVDLTKYVEQHKFTLDASFDETQNNEQVYCEVVRPLVDAAFNKAKVSCFAYGQTGSGKTYTMMGDPGDENKPAIPGLYLLAAQDIFQLLQHPQFQQLSLHISFYEIYCGKLYDLLNERQLLQIREDGKQNVNIVGITENNITDIQSLMKLISFGMSVRVTNMTGANDDSSRSHAILQVVLKEKVGEKYKPFGKMSFIDLAGSERAADVTDMNKQTRMDGAEINKSLLALKECIRALDQNNGHTPFRGSKLTLVLKDSFIGNCKTVMIGNISAASSCCENTLNTLRYADRVKELKRGGSAANNVAKTNADKLAQQLMLPRQNKNSKKTMLNENDLDQNSAPKSRTKQQSLNNLAKPNKPIWQDIMEPQQQQSIQNDLYSDFNQFNLPNRLNEPFQNIQNIQCQKMTTPQSKPNQINFFQNNSLNKQQNDNNQFQFNQQMDLEEPLQYQPNIMQQNTPQILQPYQNMDQFFQTNNQINQNNIPKKEDVKSINFQYPTNSQQTLNDISSNHEKLIQVILNEEENLISNHRKHIDEVVELTKNDMLILQQVEQPGSDIDNYLNKLENQLAQQIQMASRLKSQVEQFKSHLKEEAQLSKMFYQQKSESNNNDMFNLKNSDMEIQDMQNDNLISNIQV